MKSESRVCAGQSGQVLTFFAIVVPIVLLPITGYAIDASVVASRSAGLQAATAEAAETAAQKLDVEVIRANGGLALDAAAASQAASAMVTMEEPAASIESSVIDGLTVTITTAEAVTLPFSLVRRTVTLHARATARLVAGYDNPSNR